jgi:hypothetical protein
VAPTRRDFLKISTVGTVVTSMLGFDLAPAYAEMRALKIARASETRSRTVQLLDALEKSAG